MEIVVRKQHRYLSNALPKEEIQHAMALGWEASTRHFRFQVNKKEGRQVHPKQLGHLLRNHHILSS